MTETARLATERLWSLRELDDERCHASWSKPVSQSLRLLDTPSFSLFVLADLVAKVVPDVTEQWDLWCTLGHEHGCKLSTRLPSSAFRLDFLYQKAGPSEKRLLSRYRHLNAAFSQACDRLRDRSRLSIGRRGLLRAVAVSHWGRYRISVKERHQLCRLMMSTTNPKVCLSGQGVQRRPAPLG